MLEIHLTNVDAGGEYPYHDDQYLGEIASVDFIDGPTLATLTGYTAGVAINNAGGWLKYKLMDGPEILVAKLPLRYRVSWDSLNAAGLVFGTKTVPVKGKRYKVRLMKGAEKDPTDWLPTLGSDNPQILIPSEWTRLIYRSSSANVGKAETFPGTNFSNAAIGVGGAFGGRLCHCQETLAVNPAGWTENAPTNISRGHAGAGSVGAPYKKDGTASSTFDHYGWRPVLEYVEDLPTYPDSGPGTKVLQFGDTSLGYFGEVTGAELFTANQFIDQTGAWFGTRETTPNTMNELWLKFFFKGKVIYIAKYPFINNIGWNDVYNAGLMYGTQDNGKYPIAAAPVYQFNPLFKNDGRDWVLVPRNIKGLNTDPFSSYNTAADWSGSEWTELLGRVAAVTNTPVDEKWASFTGAQLGLDGGRYTIGQETSAGSSANAVFMGVGYPARGAVVKTQQNLGYRPVLELVDTATVLVPALPVIIDPEGLAQLEMWEGKVDANTIALRPESPYIADFTSKLLCASYSIDPSSAFAPINVTANDDTPTWGSFTISGTYID